MRLLTVTLKTKTGWTFIDSHTVDGLPGALAFIKKHGDDMDYAYVHTWDRRSVAEYRREGEKWKRVHDDN